jgi:tRNA A37 threonylcarbamoyladenosine synthetase subunit TsaC/SUA5/YrdC
MFIVKKKKHDPALIHSEFETIRVSDHPSIIKYFAALGQYRTASKVIIV